MQFRNKYVILSKHVLRAVLCHCQGKNVYDDFGDPVTTETHVDVPGVLVYPTTADAIVTDLQIYGKRSIYELCIPKGDAHSWEDKNVEFFGKRFHVFTPEIEYIDENVYFTASFNNWNEKLPELTECIRGISMFGMGYQGLQMDMPMNFPRPEFYNVMFEKWGLETGEVWRK